MKKTEPALQSECVVYLGTRKMVALSGRLDGDQPRISHYVSENNPEGFEGGLVTNLERATASVEKMTRALGAPGDGEEISAYVVLGNSKIKSFRFSSSLYFREARRPVSHRDIRSVIDQTRSVATLPLAEFVLQTVPESFLVDDMEGIANPTGLEAERLGATLDIFSMDFQSYKNIHNVFEAAEVEVKGFFPKALTVSEAVLSPEEKEEGTVLIDIADESAELVLWKKGRLAGTRTLPLGGRCLTARIASEWKIEMRDAEKVKERFGGLDDRHPFGEELIPLIDRNGRQDHQIRRQDFRSRFLEMTREWMTRLAAETKTFADEVQLFYPHYVLTGGGTRFDGFLEFLQKQFGWDARIGCTRKVEAPNELLVDPAMTGPCGMVRWLVTRGRDHERMTAPRGFMEKRLSAARNWFSDYF